MDDYNTDKKYESFKIPDRRQLQEGGAAQALPQANTSLAKTDTTLSLTDGLFYEIEYDSCPTEGRVTLKPQKIEPSEKDEIRDLFYRMRDISRQNRSLLWDYSKFYDKRIRQENAGIFYKQAMFMKDFTDDYARQAEFSSYFPFYQMMGYEQLRTYFTWRTQVRNGNVVGTSVSYLFLYIYELINNIGVESPQDGLDKLMLFWNALKELDVPTNDMNTINKYVLRWLKDYHIYYNLPQTFKSFVEEHTLTQHYPKMADPNFDLYCAISKYDIRKSAFFTGDKSKLITDCFYFVIGRLRQVFESAGIRFDDAIFKPTKKMTVWTPFKDALFYPWFKQPDRRLVLSENEIYICIKNEWTFSTIITSEMGGQFIGYAMKQMESVLREATNYKFKLAANINMINQPTLQKMKESGLSPEKIISDAVMEFYREATKTVVTVDHSSLSRIRQEALSTQEALTVEERTEQREAETFLPEEKPVIQAVIHEASALGSVSLPDRWESLKTALSDTELQALLSILQGDIKKFAYDNGIMLEVLVDGINGKAMDYIGDSLLNDELAVYGEYEEKIRGMVE